MAVAKCPSCGMVQFDTGTGRCQDCNRDMETECPACGDRFVLAPTQTICGKCQAPLEGSTPPERKRAKTSKEEKQAMSEEEPLETLPRKRRQKRKQRIETGVSQTVKPKAATDKKRFSERSYRLLTKLIGQDALTSTDPRCVLLSKLIDQYIESELADAKM